MTGAGANWAVFVDGEKKCKLSNNRYMRIPVAPGKHSVTAKVRDVPIFKKETEVEIEAEAGILTMLLAISNKVLPAHVLN